MGCRYVCKFRGVIQIICIEVLFSKVPLAFFAIAWKATEDYLDVHAMDDDSTLIPMWKTTTLSLRLI